MAEYPMSTTVVFVMAEIRPGRASGKNTLETICPLDMPMTWAASTVPDWTSRSAVYTRRAKNGAVAMVSETVAAYGPIEVPTNHCVNGMSATIKMAYGIERVMLTITDDKIAYKVRIGANPPGRVRCKIIPMTPPMTTVATPEMLPLTSVSLMASGSAVSSARLLRSSSNQFMLCLLAWRGCGSRNRGVPG